MSVSAQYGQILPYTNSPHKKPFSFTGRYFVLKYKNSLRHRVIFILAWIGLEQL